MRHRSIALLFAAASLHGTTMSAQGESAYVGMFGLISTPAGALPPDPGLVAPSSDRTRAITARFGQWSFGPGDDESTSIAVAYSTLRGVRTIRVEVGRSMNAQCSACGATMLGVESHRPLELAGLGDATSTIPVSVGLSTALGAFRYGDLDLTGLSLTVKVPVAISAQLGRRWTLSPFFVPGYGITGVVSDGDSETGNRALLGYGVTLAHRSSPIAVTLGSQRVLLDDAPSVTGIALRLSF